jgi:hypothetical protein
MVRNQPVGYPAAGFLYPNPFLSYNESVAQGVAELMRLILMNAGQFYLCGYSQGAEVVVRTLRLMLPGQPLAHRAGDLLKVITFGSPCRPPGPTLLGNNPPGSGISRIYTPDQFRSRTYDFVLNGDMYATATDDTLLHLGYEALAPLELDLPFALKIFTLTRATSSLPFSTSPTHRRPSRRWSGRRSSSATSSSAIPTSTTTTGPTSTESPPSTVRCRSSRPARQAAHSRLGHPIG